MVDYVNRAVVVGTFSGSTAPAFALVRLGAPRLIELIQKIELIDIIKKIINLNDEDVYYYTNKKQIDKLGFSFRFDSYSI